MQTSESITKIAVALLEAQKAMSAVKKGADNPFFKSKYADLPSVIKAIKEPLNDAGIVYIQSVDMFSEGQATIETRLLHSSGEWMSSITPVFTKDRNNPQALGSGITYSKRYALQAICGLPTTDDDGEAAMDRKEKAKEIMKPTIKPEQLEGRKFRKRIGQSETPEHAVNRVMKVYNMSESDIKHIVEIWEEELSKEAAANENL